MNRFLLAIILIYTTVPCRADGTIVGKMFKFSTVGSNKILDLGKQAPLENGAGRYILIENGQKIRIFDYYESRGLFLRTTMLSEWVQMAGGSTMRLNGDSFEYVQDAIIRRIEVKVKSAGDGTLNGTARYFEKSFDAERLMREMDAGKEPGSLADFMGTKITGEHSIRLEPVTDADLIGRISEKLSRKAK